VDVGSVESFKHSDKERKIVVTALVDNGIHISIKDNAGGIEDSVKNRIFDPYFTTKGDSGTGIGLYITKKIIEDNFSGRVTVENEDGGARFDIWFPAE
jgi:signal transduction histidine kinase